MFRCRGAGRQVDKQRTVEAKPSEYIDMKPIEASEEEEEQRGGFMVVAVRAKTPAELEERARQAQADRYVIEFEEAGHDIAPSAAPSRQDSPEAADPGAISRSKAVATADIPKPAPTRVGASPGAAAKPQASATAIDEPVGDGRERLGAGKVAPGGYRVA
jgi:hypothetical protein